MRSMGIKQTTIDNVVEVVIRTADKEIVIPNAEVVCVDMKGSKSYQINGSEYERAPGSSEGSEMAAAFPEEDIELVISQTNCDREKAVKVLGECEGQPAEAIVKIMSE